MPVATCKCATVAAAISASSFITAAVHEKEPLSTHESITSVREDIGVINSSLQYVNDLLRNMLDMHKASCNQLHITLHPADLRKDILDPVAAIIYHKSKSFTVEIDCIPEDLVVTTDRIRLEQIVLNLASNSCKFVERGFVRLGAKIHESDGTVIVFVEDSGPGIPLDKRSGMFERFQASLDALNQGTGIGLSLCKSLAELLGGDVSLDESYDSGIEGCPGARFVIRLNIPPLDLQKANVCTTSHHHRHHGAADGSLNTGGDDAAYHAQELPTACRVLFVDDDVVLRKLFARAVRRVAPTWDIDEAANGETALRLVEKAEHEYNLIFLDQCTLRALRFCVEFGLENTAASHSLRFSHFVGPTVQTWQAFKSKCLEPKWYQHYAPKDTREEYVDFLQIPWSRHFSRLEPMHSCLNHFRASRFLCK
jgi:Histidine kinase-, DNA gyrase B-, and HSP90-like ATPase